MFSHDLDHFLDRAVAVLQIGYVLNWILESKVKIFSVSLTLLNIIVSVCLKVSNQGKFKGKYIKHLI